ncbi:AAA family ATPase (plasmid) [Paenibacillus thiaminolyticus]|uniref:AAA family ATPase n=1 Tax=Paenibacillus thiaminolyticus TaxID=49283 RepID=UPI00232C74D2|nr:AAA family ATPase [Paenibacillus thiaminolyticus]WCF11737.1 AAA family ATPase [Paenibacillus thiaminolyticus]
MKKILAASGQKVIDDAIRKFENYKVVDVVEFKSELNEAIQFHKPDILLLGEGLSGHESLMQLMLQFLKEYPNLRIVYLAGYVDIRDEAKISSLGVLVMAGIYDIVHEQKITLLTLRNLLDNPKTPEQMSYLLKKVNSTKKTNLIEFDIPEDEVDEVEDVYQNLFVVSSIKPGTGKSFLSTNIATAIASYGVEVNGRKPKVAIIEADLQNLSVGTLLQIEDDKKNLKSVIEKISTIVNENGTLTGDLKDTEDVNAFIKSCFKPYYRIKNLEALVGSQLAFSEIENVKPYHYVYLIESIIKEYDVIIIDSNSSLTHVTTFPLLHMAKNCYYVLNLDFNNIRNNVRYKDILKEIGILNKVKYILNEDILQDGSSDAIMAGTDIEELIYTADHLNDSDFKLEARVPLLPKSVFLNRLYEGTPVVLDDKKYTLKARYEILKAANQIWPIKNFSEVEEQVMNTKTKKKKGLFF